MHSSKLAQGGASGNAGVNPLLNPYRAAGSASVTCLAHGHCFGAEDLQ